MNDTSMGARIAAARKQLGLTQQDLADRVGVTFQAVSKWETGGSLPDLGLLPSLARTLGLGIDYLLTGEGESGAPATPTASWGRIVGTVTKDIHGDVGTIVGDVQADIHGNVRGDVTGSVRNVFGNVEGTVTGDVYGDITGYIGGSLRGTVHGRVKLGIRGKVLGVVVGDGINVDQAKGRRKKEAAGEGAAG